MDQQSSTRERASDGGQALSRRKIFRGAVGAAAVGVTGGAVLAGTASSARHLAPTSISRRPGPMRSTPPWTGSGSAKKSSKRH